MTANRAGMAETLSELMELRDKQEMDTKSFLTLLSLVSLMGLVELIGGDTEKTKTRKPGDLLLPPLGRVPVNKG